MTPKHEHRHGHGHAVAVALIDKCLPPVRVQTIPHPRAAALATAIAGLRNERKPDGGWRFIVPGRGQTLATPGGDLAPRRDSAYLAAGLTCRWVTQGGIPLRRTALPGAL